MQTIFAQNKLNYYITQYEQQSLTNKISQRQKIRAKLGKMPPPHISFSS